MKRIIVTLSAVFLAIGTIVTPVAAQVLYEATFDTPGNFENWVDFSNRLASSTVSGGVWAGTGGANNDPQLRTAEGTFGVGGLDLTSATEVNMQIRMKNNTGETVAGGVSYVSFVGATASNTAGLPVVNFNFTPTAPDTFELFNINVKDIIDGLAGTDGFLRSIRLDPLNSAPISGNTFEIDYVRISEVDAGDANLDGMVDTLDFELISDNLFNTVPVGTSGDITDDGVVNYADYRLWRDRIAALPITAAAALVPEPGSALLLSMGASYLLFRRSRQKTPLQHAALVSLIVATTMSFAPQVDAQVVYTAGFNTNGDLEGWTGMNTGTLTVSGGLLSGSNTNTDPQLENEFVTPIGGTFNFDTLSFRVRETPLAPSDPNWDAQGIVISLSSSESTAQTVFNGNSQSDLFSPVSSGSNFHTVTVDISSYSGIDIDFIRLDPIGGPDSASSSFEVDFIEITRGPLFGDVDNNGTVNLIDKNILRDNLFETGLPRSQGDLNEDGIVDFDDFREWKDFYVAPLIGAQTVPEPTSTALLLGGLACLVLGTSREKLRRSMRSFAGRTSVIVALLIAVASQVQAIDVHWEQDVDNNYATSGNWVGGIVPDGGFDEAAIIGNSTVPTGTANVSSTISGSQRPGGVTLGQQAGQSGTLNINSGGDLTVRNSPGAPAGNINVGGGGTGILNVVSGGSLTARGLILGGTASSQVNASGTAVLDFRDVDDPNFESNITLNRTTRITGPNVTFSGTGNVTLGATGTFIPEITTSSHSPISVAGLATLGGTLQAEFNGHTPIPGESWELFDAGGIANAFSSVNIPGVTLGLGEQFVLQNNAGGTNGRILSLELEQLLVLQVNRNLDTISLVNPSGSAGVGLDGYTINSASGSIQSASWSSLQDNVSFSDWEEAQNSDDFRLTEIKIQGEETLAALSSVSLGPIFNPQNPSFGVTGEDFTFEYTQEDGTNRTGVVQYVGDLPENNNTLVLQVDPTTGESILYNDSNLFNGSIQGYDIFSDSGSLLSDDLNWTSLDDLNAAGGDWRESNVSSNRLAELKEDGSTTLNLNSGTVFNLGTLFDTGGMQDLQLQFLQPGDSEPTKGIVIYEEISILGDFDGDGDVDNNDLTDPVLGWEVRYGVDLDGLDFLDWQTNFGFGVGPISSVTAVPEPCCLTLLATCSLILLRRSGRHVV